MWPYRYQQFLVDSTMVLDPFGTTALDAPVGTCRSGLCGYGPRQGSTRGRYPRECRAPNPFIRIVHSTAHVRNVSNHR